MKVWPRWRVRFVCSRTRFNSALNAATACSHSRQRALAVLLRAGECGVRLTQQLAAPRQGTSTHTLTTARLASRSGDDAEYAANSLATHTDALIIQSLTHCASHAFSCQWRGSIADVASSVWQVCACFRCCGFPPISQVCRCEFFPRQVMRFLAAYAACQKVRRDSLRGVWCFCVFLRLGACCVPYNTHAHPAPHGMTYRLS